MTHYQELETQKYYHQKANAEVKVQRRANAWNTIKNLILTTIIVGGFTLACLALIQSPEVVLNAVESLKSQGLWPW